MLRVRPLFTALAIILTGACTTTGTGTATPAAADQSLIAIPINTQSATARAEFLQGLRDFDAERFVDARHHFNAAVAADPGFALGHLYAAFDGGSLSAYRAHLDAAVAAVNRASPIEQLWIRAEQKGADNDVNGQIAIAEQIVQMTPNDPRAYGYLANAQFNANKRAEARATLDRASRVDPRFVTTWIQYGNSFLVTEPRDIAKAHTYIEKAVALQPNEALVHDYMGDVYRAENNLPQARDEYTKMAELSPTRGEGFQQRGHVNSFLGNFAEARADYDRAIMLADPTTKPAYAVYRALVSVYANDPAAAEAELDRVAANVDPGIPNATGSKIFALTEEARIALHNRHLDVAQRSIDQLRTLYRQQGAEGGTDAFRRGSEANILYWEGMLAARRGDYATARQKAQDYMATMAPDQNPRKNEPAHELLGMTEFLQGNFQAADAHFAQANADDVYIWYYRGLALEGAGRTAEAKEFFKRAAGWNFNGSGTALVKKDATRKAGS
ncbi:MAG TPA: tetratricopeptide repeat protein [Gemmatimonadaceae bacterium]|nr:tetratricopeptide repeat protein [Gemmatimonadaceae bacterium]